ncbi:MAG: NAD(+) synthase [Spirochaetota bacterium]
MTRLPSILALDPVEETRYIGEWIRRTLSRTLRRRGIVIGISGGVDSAATAALCVAAIGADRVYALLMPDRESSESSVRLGRLVAESLGVSYRTVDITSTLESLGVYRDRDQIVASIDPEYDPTIGFKIAIRSNDSLVSYFDLVTEVAGRQRRFRLDAADYLGLVAATNYKQRIRKSIEYHHADLLNFAVVGTPNRLEYDQGFFVKGGDGAADLKPIAHLYKSQVYEIARHLGVPQEVLAENPTTDTYSLDQSQEEFFFGIPLQQLDVCLFGLNNRLSVKETADHANLPCEQVELAWIRIEQKRRSTSYLHIAAELARRVPEVGQA